MKNILPLIVVISIIVSGFGAVALKNDNEKINFLINEKQNKGDRGNEFSHTIIGEFGTATWCGYCKYAHGALKNIYAGGWHPFYYVSLVCDKNTHAYQRAISELGLTGYPTVYFDGGYKAIVGAGSEESAQAQYNSSIVACGEREVNDVDIDLDVTWYGNAEMDITVTVDNNEDSTYNGHLHVYVTEIKSSMGWLDSAGLPYTFPFLEYAFNEDISVSSGGTWQDSINWDGHDYDSGYGEDFGDISYGNIMIIGAVFDDEDYVDDVTGYRIGDNSAPYTPGNPEPEDGDTEIIVETDISWICSDPEDDVLSYDIYFGKSSNPPLVASGIVGTSYSLGLLDFDTKYYWKIVAYDTQGASTSGPIWDFTTRGNSAPNSPSNPNPEDEESGVPINTCISWTCEDPDGDDVTYDVYFGKCSEDLLLVSNNQTGKSYCFEDILDFETCYMWQIVAWDEYEYKKVGPIWTFTTEENMPPNEPSDPDPFDGETDVPTEKLIRWTGGDPNQGDKVRYDVYFGTSNPPTLVVEGLLQTAYDPGIMEFETTYYWMIESEDSQGLITTGQIWSFTTEKQNEPPTSPDIDGPPKGAVGVELCWTFHSDDPNEDEVKYIIDWGDGNTEETDYQQACSPVEVCHTYEEEGTYTIKATAEDDKGLESAESTFQVNIPRERYIHNIFVQRLYERFLIWFQMCRNLLGL